MTKPKPKTKPQGAARPVGNEPHEISAARRAEYDRMDRERYERDKAMVLDPGRWPRWPLLPVKGRTTAAKQLDWDTPDAFGFVFAGDVGAGISRTTAPVEMQADAPKWRVYFGLTFGIGEKVAEAWREGQTGVATWAAVLAKFEHHDYESVDKLVEVYTVD